MSLVKVYTGPYFLCKFNKSWLFIRSDYGTWLSSAVKLKVKPAVAEIELHSVSNVKSKSSLTVIKHSSTAPSTGRTLHSYSESAPLLCDRYLPPSYRYSPKPLLWRSARSLNELDFYLYARVYLSVRPHVCVDGGHGGFALACAPWQASVLQEQRLDEWRTNYFNMWSGSWPPCLCVWVLGFPLHVPSGPQTHAILQKEC